MNTSNKSTRISHLTRASVMVGAALVLSACVSAPVPQPVAPPQPAPEPARVQTNEGSLRVLAQVEELKEEIRSLRAQVEEQQNLVTQMQTRSGEVYDDIDSRLRNQETAIENTQSEIQNVVIAPQPASATMPVQPQATQPVAPQPGLIQPTVQPANPNPVVMPAPVPAPIPETSTGQVMASQPAVQPVPQPVPQPEVQPTAQLEIAQPVVIAPAPAQPEPAQPVVAAPAQPEPAQAVMAAPTQPGVTPNTTMAADTGTVVIGSTASISGTGAIAQPTLSQPATPTADTQAADTQAEPTAVASAAPVEMVPASPAATDAYDAAFELLKQGRYNEATVAFENFQKTHANTDLSDDASYWIAESRRVSRQFEGALTGYQELMQRFPTSPKVPDAMLKVGVIQYEIGAYADARNTLGEVLIRYPGSRQAASAAKRITRMDTENR